VTNLWSGRFDEAPDADLFRFGASFRFDRRLFEEDVTGSLAWAEALADAGALSAADRASIQEGLRAILEAGKSDPAYFDRDGVDDEDVHAFVERKLVERVGEAGKRLHTGRSRNEQVSLDLRLYLRRRIPLIQHGAAALIAALSDQARAAGEARMPAYTHLRRAQPILVAQFFLGHAAAIRRDVERFAAAREEADALPLGSGAVAGTNYAVDPARLARMLGFSRVVANSVDATSDRDFAAAFLHASALTMVHLSRLAEDLILMSGEEFGFFELADAVATGSSLMPQKKNPDPLELVRGKTGRVIGHLTGVLVTMKGLASGYNKDLQEDKEAIFDTEDTLASCLRAATRVVATLVLHRDPTERAASGLLLATEVADYLVARGMPFRRAHELVGGLVRQLSRDGRDFSSLSLAEWKGFSDLFDEDVRAHATTAASVAAKRTPQSTNPDAVAHQLKELDAWLRKAGW
jgi:argininosuccinate lyase